MYAQSKSRKGEIPTLQLLLALSRPQASRSLTNKKKLEKIVLERVFTSYVTITFQLGADATGASVSPYY
jgi:hypothetical protein